jgi:hypothetical protein
MPSMDEPPVLSQRAILSRLEKSHEEVIHYGEPRGYLMDETVIMLIAL